ncbi:multidrug resistance protein, MATE family [Colwellia chukchiensis]|uniref:Multidrug resistance protein, MATE family n=1 Tax=Colwellia chukchiensis TaxID=641665 RepID=A0A1H7PZP4_9GAMM|nr:MATE family efflux transporter [Colwellia chukchiensis]SEL41381.1 multidrug resistance protein, MATE family [Colwellia chukchiensis]
MKFNDLERHKQLFILALPMILSNITAPLLGLIDTAVIGHLEHAYYLGGSTVGAMIITAVTWLCGFLRMSTTGLSAQAFGQQNQQLNNLVLLRGIIVALAIGLAVIVLQSLYIDVALSLAGGSSEVQLYARQYSEIRVWGLPAALANLVILGWLLGNHQAKVVMWLIIATNLINLVLDLLFVIGFGWQVKGVAAATLIAEYSGLLLGLTMILRHYKQRFTGLFSSAQQLMTELFERSALLSYFKLNRDILIRTLCLEICFIFMTFQGARLGDDVIAANAILMNFLMLISFGLDGVANAAEVMVGKAKGENNRQAIFVSVNIALLWTGLFAVSYSLLFYLLGDYFIVMISDITSVVSYAQRHLFWLIALPLLACWCYLYDGVYVGLMQADIMRNSMLIATFGCFFPVWWLLQDYGNHGLWAAFSVFMLARGLTLAIHYQGNRHNM